MTKLAVRRQAPPLSKGDLEVYREDLEPYPVEDIAAVCVQIGHTPREEGQTSFPPVGDLIRALDALAASRRPRPMPFPEVYQPCGKHIVGYLVWNAEHTAMTTCACRLGYIHRRETFEAEQSLALAVTR